MAKKKLKIGALAPDFELPSYNKGMISLSKEYSDENGGANKVKYVVLIFSRYFGCPICQLDLLELLKIKEKIAELGGKIIYITQSSEEIAKGFIDKYSIDFPVVYSPKDGLYSKYGLGKMSISTIAKVPGRLKNAKSKGLKHGKYEGSESQTPGQFLIGNDGKIVHLEIGWFNSDSLLEAMS